MVQSSHGNELEQVYFDNQTKESNCSCRMPFFFRDSKLAKIGLECSVFEAKVITLTISFEEETFFVYRFVSKAPHSYTIGNERTEQ